MHHLRAIVITILFSMILAGCGGVHSVHPFGPEEDARHDDNLLGVWLIDGTDSPMYVHVTKDTAPWLRIAAVEHKGDGGYELTEMRAFTSVIDGRHFLNIHQVQGKKEADTYFFIGYRVVDADHIEFAPLNEDLFYRAVKDGTLTGESRGDGAPTLFLSDDTKTLRAFVTKHGDVLNTGNNGKRPILVRVVPAP